MSEYSVQSSSYVTAPFSNVSQFSRSIFACLERRSDIVLIFCDFVESGCGARDVEPFICAGAIKSSILTL